MLWADKTVEVIGDFIANYPLYLQTRPATAHCMAAAGAGLFPHSRACALSASVVRCCPGDPWCQERDRVWLFGGTDSPLSASSGCRREAGESFPGPLRSSRLRA